MVHSQRLQSGSGSTVGASPIVRWHNHLPSWILDDPRYKGDDLADPIIRPLDSFGRMILQAIADACDRPLRKEADLDGAFCSLSELSERTGCAVQTARRRIKALIGKQFLVRKLRGGDLRVATKSGTLTPKSNYVIPGVKPPPSDSNLGAGCTLGMPHGHPPPTPRAPNHLMNHH